MVTSIEIENSLAAGSYVNVVTVLERFKLACKQIQVPVKAAVLWIQSTIMCTQLNRF